MNAVKSVLKQQLPRWAGYQLKKIILFVRGIAYRGNAFYCPICQQGYVKFFDGGFDLPVIDQMQIIGAGRRKNIICPGCASNDRDRLVYLALQAPQLQLLPAKKILHIAPEPALVGFLQKNQQLDGNTYIMGVKYHEGFYYDNNIQLIDLTALEFDDHMFDLLICNHVLEHIADDDRAMREIFRVVKPEGKAILQVPWSPLLEKTYENEAIIKPKDRETHFGQFDHVRLYGKDYAAKLMKTGFIIDQLGINDLAPKDKAIEKYALNTKEVIFVGTKPSEPHVKPAIS